MAVRAVNWSNIWPTALGTLLASAIVAVVISFNNRFGFWIKVFLLIVALIFCVLGITYLRYRKLGASGLNRPAVDRWFDERVRKLWDYRPLGMVFPQIYGDGVSVFFHSKNWTPGHVGAVFHELSVREKIPLMDALYFSFSAHMLETGFTDRVYVVPWGRPNWRERQLVDEDYRQPLPDGLAASILSFFPAEPQDGGPPLVVVVDAGKILGEKGLVPTPAFTYAAQQSVDPAYMRDWRRDARGHVGNRDVLPHDLGPGKGDYPRRYGKRVRKLFRSWAAAQHLAQSDHAIPDTFGILMWEMETHKLALASLLENGSAGRAGLIHGRTIRYGVWRRELPVTGATALSFDATDTQIVKSIESCGWFLSRKYLQITNAIGDTRTMPRDGGKTNKGDGIDQLRGRKAILAHRFTALRNEILKGFEVA